MHRDDSTTTRVEVLGGLHSGAAVTLAEGELIVGSDPACQMVLLDAEVAARAATLRCEGGVVRIRALDAAVSLESGVLSPEDGEQALARGERFSVGPVALRVDPAATASEGGESELVRGASSSAMAIAARLTERMPSLDRVRQIGGLGDMSQPVRIAGQAALVFVGLAASLVWAGSLLPSGPANASDTPDIEAEALRLMAWSEQTGGAELVVHASDSTLVVRGVFADEGQRQVFDSLVDELEHPVRGNVQLADAVAERAELLLGQLGVTEPSVEPLGGGRYAVRGYPGSDRDWDSRRAALLRDLTPIRSLEESGVLTLERLVASLREDVASAGLEDEILVRSEQGAITATGMLPGPGVRAWQGIAAAFERRHGRHVDFSEAVHHVRDVLGFSVRSISHGELPYVTTADGRRFMQGSTLPGGYVLRHIAPDALTVIKRGQSFEYPLFD